MAMRAQAVASGDWRLVQLFSDCCTYGHFSVEGTIYYGETVSPLLPDALTPGNRHAGGRPWFWHRRGKRRDRVSRAGSGAGGGSITALPPCT